MELNLIEYQGSVTFADTDVAGVAHFSTILRYAEEAEHALLEKMRIPVISHEGGFPKVRVECDYTAPMRFGDAFSVKLHLVQISNKSLRWGFVITVSNVCCASGELVTVLVNSEGKSVEIPQQWREKLETLG